MNDKEIDLWEGFFLGGKGGNFFFNFVTARSGINSHNVLVVTLAMLNKHYENNYFKTSWWTGFPVWRQLLTPNWEMKFVDALQANLLLFSIDYWTIMLLYFNLVFRENNILWTGKKNPKLIFKRF